MNETPIWDEIADAYPGRGHPLAADDDDWGLSPDCQIGLHEGCHGQECRCVCHAVAAANDLPKEAAA